MSQEVGKLTNMERKQKLMEILLKSDKPVSGSYLADKFGVTRQIIVKDIALLRAEGNNIMSTTRGYITDKNKSVAKKEVWVNHSADKIADELETIVDLGGRVLNTYIDHPAYGSFGETLNVKSRRDVDEFVNKIALTGCEPLLKLTNGPHAHVIEADSEERLDEIISALDKKGYLIK